MKSASHTQRKTPLLSPPEHLPERQPEHVAEIIPRVLEEWEREDLKIIVVEPKLYPEVVV